MGSLHLSECNITGRQKPGRKFSVWKKETLQCETPCMIHRLGWVCNERLFSANRFTSVVQIQIDIKQPNRSGGYIDPHWAKWAIRFYGWQTFSIWNFFSKSQNIRSFKIGNFMAFSTEKSILQFWSKNPQFGLQGVEGVWHVNFSLNLKISICVKGCFF